MKRSKVAMLSRAAGIMFGSKKGWHWGTHAYARENEQGGLTVCVNSALRQAEKEVFLNAKEDITDDGGFNESSKEYQVKTRDGLEIQREMVRSIVEMYPEMFGANDEYIDRADGSELHGMLVTFNDSGVTQDMMEDVLWKTEGKLLEKEYPIAFRGAKEPTLPFVDSIEA